MYRTNDGVRLFEGRLDELVDHIDSRSIATPEGREPKVRTDRIELSTEADRKIELTLDGNEILIEERADEQTE